MCPRFKLKDEYPDMTIGKEARVVQFTSKNIQCLGCGRLCGIGNGENSRTTPKRHVSGFRKEPRQLRALPVHSG